MSTKKDCISNFSEILGRLLQVSGKLNEYEIADLLGFKKDTFAARKSRGSLPEKEIKLACVSNGWSFEWVMSGKGEMLAENRNSLVAEPPTDYISMPVRALGGAGNPCELQSLEPIRYITVHKDYDGPNIRVVEIRGRSMEPVIMNGAVVGVDISDKQIESGELYACYIPNEGVVVKRILMSPDMVTIQSDNKNHDDCVMMMDRVNWDTFICGRVKWVIQKY